MKTQKDSNIENDDQSKDLNRDPITGEPGSHPLGTGLGSAGGAAAGAAIGAVGGPIGMAIGGAIGAVAGGVVGHEVAEGMDPTAEDAYWSENFRKEPYNQQDFDYPDYQPAYRAGYTSYGARPTASFAEIQEELSRQWSQNRGESRLDWEKARPAAEAGFNRAQSSSTRSRSASRANEGHDPLTERRM